MMMGGRFQYVVPIKEEMRRRCGQGEGGGGASGRHLWWDQTNGGIANGMGNETEPIRPTVDGTDGRTDTGSGKNYR